MSLNLMYDKRCNTLITVEMHAGTIEDPHIIREHGTCAEVKIVTDPEQLAEHGR